MVKYVLFGVFFTHFYISEIPPFSLHITVGRPLSLLCNIPLCTAVPLEGAGILWALPMWLCLHALLVHVCMHDFCWLWAWTWKCWIIGTVHVQLHCFLLVFQSGGTDLHSYQHVSFAPRPWKQFISRFAAMFGFLDPLSERRSFHPPLAPIVRPEKSVGHSGAAFEGHLLQLVFLVCFKDRFLCLVSRNCNMMWLDSLFLRSWLGFVEPLNFAGWCLCLVLENERLSLTFSSVLQVTGIGPAHQGPPRLPVFCCCLFFLRFVLNILNSPFSALTSYLVVSGVLWLGR